MNDTQWMFTAFLCRHQTVGRRFRELLLRRYLKENIKLKESKNALFNSEKKAFDFEKNHYATEKEIVMVDTCGQTNHHAWYP